MKPASGTEVLALASMTVLLVLVIVVVYNSSLLRAQLAAPATLAETFAGQGPRRAGPGGHGRRDDYDAWHVRRWRGWRSRRHLPRGLSGGEMPHIDPGYDLDRPMCCGCSDVPPPV